MSLTNLAKEVLAFRKIPSVCLKPQTPIKSTRLKSTWKLHPSSSLIQSSPLVPKLIKKTSIFGNNIDRYLYNRRYYCEEAIETVDASCPSTTEPLPTAKPLEWNIFQAPDILSEYSSGKIKSSLDIPRLVELAKANVRKTLKHSFKLDPEQAGEALSERILVIYDTQCLLTQILAQAYGSALNPKNTLMVDFDQTTSAQLKATIDTMKAGEMVVLVQSDTFRLNDYRLRIELFKVGIKNLEHSHLNMMPDNQVETYLNAMAFAPTPEIKALAQGLKKQLDSSNHVVVRSHGGVECVYDCQFENTLLNIGDYEGMTSVGGTFPVGEIFTEPKDLDKVNGEFMVFGYPNTKFDMQHLDKPFKIRIEKGQLVEHYDAPQSFVEVVNMIKEQEGEEGGGILIREFGVGLNKALGRKQPLQNVTAFERQAGFHISLGRKHLFKKDGISRNKSRFHIDVFVDLAEIEVNGKLVFKDGDFCL